MQTTCGIKDNYIVSVVTGMLYSLLCSFGFQF